VVASYSAAEGVPGGEGAVALKVPLPGEIGRPLHRGDLRDSGQMERPPVRRRLGAVAIDVGLLALAAPILALALGTALSWAFYLPVRKNCVDPCDGPAMAGFGLALMLLWLLWGAAPRGVVGMRASS
jgi:hypothetical protein